MLGEVDGETFWALQLRWLPTAAAEAVNVCVDGLAQENHNT